MQMVPSVYEPLCRTLGSIKLRLNALLHLYLELSLGQLTWQIHCQALQGCINGLGACR